MQDGCATLRDLVGDQSANVRTVFTVNGREREPDTPWRGEVETALERERDKQEEEEVKEEREREVDL